MHDKSQARGRAAAGVMAGCAAALALVLAPVSAVATPSSGAGAPAAGTITTLAGGPGGPTLATKIAFRGRNECDDVQFADGHLYIGDEAGSVVRAVDTRTDALTTPAGDGGLGGFDGDSVLAANAELDDPCAATIDGVGNLVIADEANGRVRVVAARTGTFYGQHLVAGDIYTVASGDGPCVFSDQPSSLFCPADVITDRNGNILVSNAGTRSFGAQPVAQVIAVPERSGNFYGQKMVAGQEYVLATGGGGQLAVDHSGNVLMVTTSQVKVLAEKTGRFYGLAMTRGQTYVVAGTDTAGSSGVGGPARKAEIAPTGVAVDHAGNVVIADSPGVGHILVVAARTGTFYGKRMKAGDIYQIAGVFKGLTGNGVPAAKADVSEPSSLAIDSHGDVAFIAGKTVRVIAELAGSFYGQHLKAGDVYTVLGNPSGILYKGEGGPATSAQDVTGGVAVDAAGNLLVANRALRVVAASTRTFYGKAMTKGHIYTIAGSGARDTGGTWVGDGGSAVKAKLSAADVAVDALGNLVVTDAGGHRIRVVAKRTGRFYGRPMTAGHIYTVAGDGVKGFSGDRGLAVSARIDDPQGLAIDAAGNLVFIDAGSKRVRVVAKKTGRFYDQAMTEGHIYTVAGCKCSVKNTGDGRPALKANFVFPQNEPDQVAIDAAGNLVVTSDGLIRVIAESTRPFYGQSMTAGHVYRVAGDSKASTFANGVPATSSALDEAGGVAVDGHGNLIIGDTGDEEVRIVAATSGTFYGVPMIVGDIYALAGDQHFGLSGDGGPSTSALVCRPSWVIANHGNVIVNDSCNGRIREIQGGP